MGTGQHEFGVVDGSGLEDGVIWQHVSNSYHIWDAMYCGPQGGDIFSLL
jgi:hypothetical protein